MFCGSFTSQQAIRQIVIPSDFLEFEIINLTINFDKGLQRVIQKLKVIPEISFESFSPIEFERFTYDLLKEFRFKNIHSENNRSFDFIADSYAKDIFGIPSKETWMIEVKFYKETRFSINSLQQIVNLHQNLIDYKDAKILLITNSILTSVAEEYIEEIKQKENIEIKVLDGVLLKKIISKRKRILKKYFIK